MLLPKSRRRWWRRPPIRHFDETTPDQMNEITIGWVNELLSKSGGPFNACSSTTAVIGGSVAADQIFCFLAAHGWTERRPFINIFSYEENSISITREQLLTLFVGHLYAAGAGPFLKRPKRRSRIITLLLTLALLFILLL